MIQTRRGRGREEEEEEEEGEEEDGGGEAAATTEVPFGRARERATRERRPIIEPVRAVSLAVIGPVACTDTSCVCTRRPLPANGRMRPGTLEFGRVIRDSGANILEGCRGFFVRPRVVVVVVDWGDHWSQVPDRQRYKLCILCEGRVEANEGNIQTRAPNDECAVVGDR